jgi:hypothetical protein
MEEKGINLSKFWQQRSGCFQSSSCAVSCLLVPKKNSSATLFHFMGCFERETDQECAP